MIRVLLVDDHPVVSEGVRAYLSGHGIDVAGQASDALEALAKAEKLRPDVIVLDVNLPSMDGGELARRLRRRVPKSRIIAFSIHSSEEYVVRMARCGARGYVMKDQPTADLLEGIRHVHLGGLYFPPAMADVLLSPHAAVAAPGSGSALTGRELEVLALVSGGFSNKEAAARLGISVRTVETHREHLSRKLHIPTAAGLTKYAIRHGLTTLK
jgi:two-component system nitrate/nitrite response regulator NarL